jgi:hypothetical protein
MAVTLHTSLGDIKMELYCDRAPKSCENFLALAASNYYDNTVFHRNIKGAAPRSIPPVHGHILRNGGCPDALAALGACTWAPLPGPHVSDADRKDWQVSCCKAATQLGREKEVNAPCSALPAAAAAQARRRCRRMGGKA